MKTTSVFARNIEAYNTGQYRYIVNKGGTRSGKTFSILQLLFLLAYYDPKPTVTSVVSETLPHLKRGAIRDFKTILGADGLFEDRRWNRTECIYTFPNGSKIEFFGADSSAKVHGAARDRLFINECQNIRYETARQLFVRTRETIWLDFNPTHEFWIDTQIVNSGRECVIHSTYLDNEFLSLEQVTEIEANKSDKQWWRVYGLGLTGRLEGVIFDFQQIDEMPDSTGMVETYGLDFGFTNDPSVLVHCLIHTGRKEIYVDQLEYRTGMLNHHIIEAMRAHGVPTRGVPIFGDAAEPKSIAEIAQAGFNCRPCYKATRKAEQIAYIQQYRLFVTKRSVEGIKELRQYSWQKDKDGRPLNEPQSFNDHFCDAFRYACYSPFADFRKQGHYSITIK